MAKVISQETFDDDVKENIIDFSLSPEEAREETIKQFEAQGINLANIIKDLSINEKTGKTMLNESIEKLKAHISGEKELGNPELITNINLLQSECKKSVPHKVLAGKYCAHEVIITILEQKLVDIANNRDVVLAALGAANALTNKQPDIFSAEALAAILKILQNHKDVDLLSGALKWMAKACILHEINRQNIMDADVIKYLKPLISLKDSQFIRDLCAVFRYLILDDIRVEFGKAHEHARIIASETIVDLTKEFNDVNVVSDLLLTIASLAVRHEFCVAVEEADGLKYVFDVLVKFPDDTKLNREALKLLRALVGHDNVKRNIVQKGAAPIIHSIFNTHKTNETLVPVALVCISTLTLREKENSVAFFETGIAEVIAETMRLHPKNKTVQRNAAWAIRNMVSRARDQCETFLSHGVDDLLNTAMVEHPTVRQDLKAALRDLACKVDLKEEWTGKAEKKFLTKIKKTPRERHRCANFSFLFLKKWFILLL